MHRRMYLLIWLSLPLGHGCTDYALQEKATEDDATTTAEAEPPTPPADEPPDARDSADDDDDTTTGTTSTTEANEPPSITITAPDPAGTFYTDIGVILQAEVSDPDHPADSLRVTWSSDRGDALPLELVPDATGQVTTEHRLSDGVHTLTATVTDPQGATGSSAVTVTLSGEYNTGTECGSVPAYTLPTCAEATGIYFSEIFRSDPVIYRMDTDGSSLTALYNEVADDLEVDLAGDRLYWVRGDAIIERAPLGGGAIETVQPALPYAYGIALHPFARRIYWTNQVGTPKVEQSCFWGGSTTAVLPSLGPGGNCCAIGIDIDFDTEKIYWMDGYYGGPISRMNLDGTGLEVLTYTVGIGNGIAVDHRGGKIYWTEYGGSGSSVIRRAELDGSNVETLLTTMDGLATPQHIAVDPAGGKIYWADIDGEAQIARANLDGSGMESLYSGGREIRAIALERQSPCR